MKKTINFIKDILFSKQFFKELIKIKLQSRGVAGQYG